MKKTCRIADMVITIEYQYSDYFLSNLEEYETTDQSEYQIISSLVDEIYLLDHPYMEDTYRRFFKIDQREVIQVINHDNQVRYQIIYDTIKNETLITQVEALSKNPAEMEYIFISMAFLEYATSKGYIALHASSVVIHDEVYLFSAPSQTGKSTHARNYLKHFKEAFILNDDKPLIKNHMVYGTPFSGKEKKNKNQVFPIKAIYFIEQGEKDEIYPLNINEAVPKVLKNILRPSDEKTWDLIIPNINFILKDIPLYQAKLTLNSNNVYMTYYEPHKEKTMKLKAGFTLKEVGNQFMVLPVGEGALNFNGIISLNKSGKFLFELLQNEITLDDMVKNLMNKYEIDELTAKKDSLAFVQTLKDKGLLE